MRLSFRNAVITYKPTWGMFSGVRRIWLMKMCGHVCVITYIQPYVICVTWYIKTDTGWYLCGPVLDFFLWVIWLNIMHTEEFLKFHWNLKSWLERGVCVCRRPYVMCVLPFPHSHGLWSSFLEVSAELLYTNAPHSLLKVV